MKLSWKNFSFDFSRRTYIMGILNVTPDSFSDGGAFYNMEDAVEQALKLEEEGADIIDIGGESTRPGSETVSVREEIARVIPVIDAVSKKVKIPLSVDTYKSVVAEAAIRAGASIVNDISGLRFDRNMARVIAKYDLPVVVMHIKGRPKNMQKNPVYKALIPEIIDYLYGSIDIARQTGIGEDRIIIDPGIGFGKTVEDNLEIIKNLHRFTDFEKPLLLGHSRKSFIGKVLDDLPALPTGQAGDRQVLPVNERVEGTAAAAAIGIINGANIIRVHDVKEMVRVAKLSDAVKRGF